LDVNSIYLDEDMQIVFKCIAATSTTIFSFFRINFILSKMIEQSSHWPEKYLTTGKGMERDM